MDQPRRTLAPLQSPPFLARCAVSTIFFINGAVLASWVPHIPAVKAQHAISDGQLGIVLLSMAVGSVLALPLEGFTGCRQELRSLPSPRQDTLAFLPGRR